VPLTVAPVPAANVGCPTPNHRKSTSAPTGNACVEFCELYDQNCFDPAYDSLPVETFEPMVRRVFSEPRYLDDSSLP